MNPARTAVRALRRCIRALGHPAIDGEARVQFAAQAEAALDLLDAADRRRLASDALARRVVQLERQLADRDPGERRGIICERLGLSRASFYRLRQSHSRETADR